MFVQHRFEKKERFLSVLAIRLHNNVILISENANFWKRVSKRKFLKMILLSSQCTLCKFVKTWRHAHAHYVFSLQECICVKETVWQSNNANYWPEMHNTVTVHTAGRNEEHEDEELTQNNSL